MTRASLFLRTEPHPNGPLTGTALLSLSVCRIGSDDPGYLTATGELDLGELRALKRDLDAAIARLEARAQAALTVAEVTP